MFLRPDFHIKNFMIGEDMHVADFGSGTGIYSLLAADLVGENGKVYAIDLQPELLRAVQAEANLRGASHVHILHGDVEKIGGSGLADQSVDRVLLANIMHQIEKKEAVFNEVRRVLKPKGIAILVDWHGEENGIVGLGPIPEFIFPQQAAARLADSLGFTHAGMVDVGDYHYGIALRKT